MLLILALILLGFVCTFYALCIICDDYLVPAVEVFIEQYNIPEEVAAVTLVAFGSAAPELFLNSVSAVTHTSDLSLSAILGSGMIAFGLIPSLCVLSATPSVIHLQMYPIVRECIFYVIGLLLFLVTILDGVIYTSEAFSIVCVYFCYLGVVLCIYWRSDLKQAVVALRAGSPLSGHHHHHRHHLHSHSPQHINQQRLSGLNSTSQDSITSSGSSPCHKNIKNSGADNNNRNNNRAALTAFGGRNSPSAAVQRSQDSANSSNVSPVSATIRRSSGAAVRNSSIANNGENISSIGGDLSPISPAGADDPTLLSRAAASMINSDGSETEDEDNRSDTNDNHDDDDVAIFSPLLPVKQSIGPNQKKWQMREITTETTQETGMCVEMGNVVAESSPMNNQNNSSVEEGRGSSNNHNQARVYAFHEDVDMIEPSISRHSGHAAVMGCARRSIVMVNSMFMRPLTIIIKTIMPQLHPVEANNNSSNTSSRSKSSPAPGNNNSSANHLSLEEGHTAENMEYSHRDTENDVNNNNNNNNNNNSNEADTRSEESDCNEDVPVARAVWVFLCTIVAIAMLAGCIVSFSQQLISVLGVGSSTLGATLVALGAEIPDALTAVALARGGYFDAAIAGAIGSQVINISLGVGLPSLYVCLSSKDGVLSIDQGPLESIRLLTALLLVVISCYIAASLPLAHFACYINNGVFHFRRLLCRGGDTMIRGTANSGGAGVGRFGSTNGQLSPLQREETSCECQLPEQTSVTKPSFVALLTVWTIAYVVFILKNSEGGAFEDDPSAATIGSEFNATASMTRV